MTQPRMTSGPGRPWHRLSILAHPEKHPYISVYLTSPYTSFAHPIHWKWTGTESDKVPVKVMVTPWSEPQLSGCKDFTCGLGSAWCSAHNQTKRYVTRASKNCQDSEGRNGQGYGESPQVASCQHCMLGGQTISDHSMGCGSKTCTLALHIP